MGIVSEGEVYVSGDSFGMCLHMASGRVLLYDDVDCTQESVERLIARLRGEDIDLEQISELVQDHLVREYTVKQ